MIVGENWPDCPPATQVINSNTRMAEIESGGELPGNVAEQVLLNVHTLAPNQFCRIAVSNGFIGNEEKTASFQFFHRDPSVLVVGTKIDSSAGATENNVYDAETSAMGWNRNELRVVDNEGGFGTYTFG